MSKLIEITATYLSERNRFENADGDVVIATAWLNGSENREITIKGQADLDELLRDQEYRFYGKWTSHAKYGEQFHFQSFVLQQPHSKQGVIQYLRQAAEGVGAGFGLARATRCWDFYGSDAVRMLREEPAAVAERLSASGAMAKLSVENAEKIAAVLREQQQLEGCSLDLIDLLAGRGFPKSTSRLAVRRWGNRAAQIIRRNPYRLMEFRGCGFKKTDALYLDLGLPPARLKRQALSAWYAIARDTEGNTWFPWEFGAAGVEANIAAAELKIEKAIRAARIAGYLSQLTTTTVSGPLVDGGERRWLAEGKKAANEGELAECVVNALDELNPRHVSHFETAVECEEVIPEYARCQRCRRKLTAEMVAVLGDIPFGPDCIEKVQNGSNAERIPLADWLARHATIVEHHYEQFVEQEEIRLPSYWPDDPSVLKNFDHRITPHQIDELKKALSGPIGILGGGPGCGKTWCVSLLVKHLVSILGYGSIGIGAPTGKAAVRVTEALSGYGLSLRARTWHSMLAMLPRQNATHFPYKVLIGDETSMCDTDLMANIFRHRSAGTHVLLVGDVNQLAPVGHGAPLRDLIGAGLPYGELREIKRASGGIVEACAAIRDSQPWSEGDNLRIVHAGNPERQIADMVRTLAEQRGAGRNPIWDCQVVVPVNKKSPLSRKELNKLLQNELNPNGGIDSSPFRLGDKIVNTKNGFFPSVEFDASDPDTATNERGEVYVANGELAEVIEVQPSFTVAKLQNPARTVKIPRGKGGEERDGDDDQAVDENAPTTGCSWDLGFALSVHKSQGSEWPVVVVMIDDYPGAKMVCSREWIYTALSRAKELCVLIGKKTTADGMCRRPALGKRKTFLRERILREQAKRELADL